MGKLETHQEVAIVAVGLNSCAPGWIMRAWQSRTIFCPIIWALQPIRYSSKLEAIWYKILLHFLKYDRINLLKYMHT